MGRPANPFSQAALWCGYWLGKIELFATVASAACLALGGGILANNWVAGAVLIGVGAAIPGFILYWKRKGRALDDTALGRERLLEEKPHPLLERAASAVPLPRNERTTEARRAAEKAVDDLAWAFGTVPGVRTVVFGVSDDGKRMSPLFHAGRQHRPGDFVRGTPRGDRAFEVLEGKEPYVSVSDLTKVDTEAWAGSGEGYETFITAPIRSSDDGLGLLTIDAAQAGTLDKRHAATLSLFAATLAVLFAEAARGGR